MINYLNLIIERNLMSDEIEIQCQTR